MNDWNPAEYLRFEKERTLPARDLIRRIEDAKPRTVLDLGCGPGNSTMALRQIWPEAKISGLDSSPAMIEKAKTVSSDVRWILGDAGEYRSAEPYDLVYSNALVQWLSGQDRVLKNFAQLTAAGGSLAVQLPLFWDMPLGQIIYETAKKKTWAETMDGVSEKLIIHSPEEYYDFLSPHFKAVELWVTSYYHVFRSHGQIMDMIRTTGMKPYLECLNDEEQKQSWEKEVFDQVCKAYPVQKDGVVLFPFKRLFFVGRR